MKSEMVMGLIIISIVAGIMIIIGISQLRKKDNPVGFYNVIDPPEKEEISCKTVVLEKKYQKHDIQVTC